MDGVSLTYGMTPRQHNYLDFCCRCVYTDCIPPSSLHIIIIAVSDINSKSHSSDIAHGIESHVGLNPSAVLSTILHSFISSYHSPPLMILRCRIESASNTESNKNIFIDKIDIYVQ